METIDLAVKQAAQAFTTYKKISPRQRAAFLRAIAEEINTLGDELINTASAESNLPLPRLQGERDRTTGQLRLFADLITEGSWVNARIDKGTPDIRQMQIPLGVIGIFGASNFPLAFSVAGGDTAAALAAGSTVVFKAHPAHPQTSDLVANAILTAAKNTGLPEGVFSLIHGATIDTGQQLALHPQLSAIAFTGSFRGGKALYDTATRRVVPIPVYAEMGSVNPVFFLPRVLKEKGEALAAQFLQSLTMGVGQFCTNPGVFLTLNGTDKSVPFNGPSSSYEGMENKQASVSSNETNASPSSNRSGTDLFLPTLQKGIAAMPTGRMLTPGILEAYNSGINSLRQAGAQLLGKAPATAHQASPALLQISATQALEDPALCHEVFGPSSLHISANSKEELFQLANALEGQLTATIHGTEEDLHEYAELVDILREKAGRIVINGFPTGVAVNHAMVHGGPWPATTPAAGTSVGSSAIYRFCRPVCYQDFPAYLLPPELQDENPLGIWRLFNGNFSKT
ncbi:aldehyde dehydrogenase family protein [Chitinophaga sp. SYP-B3965]|uniref:aldehyde dehydrogenase (NADP(+)) n=1 Tax=Chitinophaga sp. SYP-B3965 TaxID=2663120 RepID=UPI001299D8E1|nr:aldehyde dehydrogenase (NADP(+)) [Chitinophaga sp. SYP-B3965]MRG45004.1 aldehyde dehydrogenase family protein [Chitinophaga sp. SYP-B3965]